MIATLTTSQNWPQKNIAQSMAWAVILCELGERGGCGEIFVPTDATGRVLYYCGAREQGPKRWTAQLLSCSTLSHLADLTLEARLGWFVRQRKWVSLWPHHLLAGRDFCNDRPLNPYTISQVPDTDLLLNERSTVNRFIIPAAPVGYLLLLTERQKQGQETR
jgi:hypothetical protein